ncbi:MAG: zinc-finger domain-containing protein, partial [Bordetella sp.]|nr:zinc-finger domain-containing protein [Bordetella sp.]
QEVIELGAEDLPAYCPSPKAPLWSMHPRVFLDVTHTGQARCPYCGTEYKLKPGTVVHGH